MHPIAAKLHDEIVALDPNRKVLIESMLSQVAKGFGEKSLEQVQAVAAANDNYWGEPGSFLAIIRPYVVVDGILQIPVKGVLLNDFPYAFGSYATGYDYILKAFLRGMGDPNVKGIALIIDSPGGMVAGCFDACDKMVSFRGVKPIRAFAHEAAYSAGYAVASIADKIVVSRTGGVGSIGVLTSHVSYEEALKKMGLEITYIFAGKHKVDGNSAEKLPEAVRDRIQARIDVLYDIFVGTVARNRNMEEKAVRETQAGTFMASEAVKNGLADIIGTLDDETATFASELETGDENMTTRNADQQKHFDEGKADAKATHDAALTTATTNATTAGKAEGAKAERERVNGILACANAKDRPVAALAAAMDTDMSVESANTFLGKLPKESPAAAGQGASGGGSGKQTQAAKDFETAMNNAQHPEAGASADDAQGQGEGAAQPSRAKRAMALAGKEVKAA